MVTFSAWLGDQRKRDDQTGWVAKFWAELDQKPRLSSPASIERHIAERGLFESNAGLREAWDAMMGEYRQQRLVNAAAEGGVTPEQLAAGSAQPLPGMSPGEIVAGAAQAGLAAAQAHDPGPVTLELLDHKLTMIMTALGIKGGLRPEHAMIMPPVPLPPLNWDDMHAASLRE
jgi:hypothetical protein